MKSRGSQRDRILRLLQEREGEWIPLYEITPLAAQYSARVHELRKLGYRIENKTQHHNGQVWSWFRLIEPGQAQLFEPPQSERQPKHVLEIQRTSL